MRALGYLRRLGWALWCVGTLSCSLVAPLDEVRREAKGGADASDDSDGTGTDAAVDDEAPSPHDDAGSEACRHTGTNACDPTACGCKARQSCMWEEDEAVCYDPVVDDPGAARPGERCINADGCRQGSICSEAQVCSTECTSDRECEDGSHRDAGG